MKTKKERTIEACRELAEKYRNPQEQWFFYDKECSLCYIHIKAEPKCCKGCPQADKHGLPGCMSFNTYGNATRYFRKLLGSRKNKIYPRKTPTDKTFLARAAFFDKIIPILEKAPASQFTKRGWKPFNIPLEW